MPRRLQTFLFAALLPIRTVRSPAIGRAALARVTVNYRLGIFGFFAHPDFTRESDNNSSGNYGFLDQIAAFAKGLFQRAIGESGANFAQIPNLAGVEKTGVRVANLGCGVAECAPRHARRRLDEGSDRGNVDGWLLPKDVYTIQCGRGRRSLRVWSRPNLFARQLSAATAIGRMRARGCGPITVRNTVRL